MRIKATVALTEIPIDIEMEVDPVFWLTNDEQAHACAIWKHIEENHPLALEIAENNTKYWPRTSWIENIEVI